MSTKHLLYTGIIIPLIFWLTLFICGFILSDYNHLTRMVSELGSRGTSSQFVFSSGLILCSVLSLFFVFGIYKMCRAFNQNIAPVIIILAYTISIAGAAIFPLPLRLHEIMGMPSILLILSPLLSLFLWKDKDQSMMSRKIAVISFLVMSLGFLVYAPDLLGNYMGLKQRFFHIGWSVWFVSLSYSSLKLLEKNKSKVKM
jgi:hypothetical membrane protein